jgi:hypothetical protein
VRDFAEATFGSVIVKLTGAKPCGPAVGVVTGPGADAVAWASGGPALPPPPPHAAKTRTQPVATTSAHMPRPSKRISL